MAIPWSKLDVVNQMLGLQGERPVNSLESTHPSIPGAQLYLDTTDGEVQATRWWFNTEEAELAPSLGTGYIQLPNNCLSFDAYKRLPNVTVRGDRLYNADERTYVFTQPIQGILHRLVPFDELPILARVYIGTAAMLRFQNNYDADAMKSRMLQGQEQRAYANMNAEHIRVVGANMFNSPGVAVSLSEIRGNRYTTGGSRRRWS